MFILLDHIYLFFFLDNLTSPFILISTLFFFIYKIVQIIFRTNIIFLSFLHLNILFIFIL